MKTKALLDFYNNFYIGNYFRDFRAINQELKYCAISYAPNKFESFKPAKLLKWFRVNEDDRTIASEIYPCYSLKDYNNKSKETVNKVYDRFYFDFDSDNPLAKELKKDINTAIKNKEKKGLINELREQYIELLLNEEIAKDSYNDVMKLHNYLADNGLKSYVIFSGAKGFHLYIFYPKLEEIKKENIKYLSLKVANEYKNNFKLKTLDLSVNRDSYSRIHRVPYTKHLITGLYCYPINLNDSYSNIIQTAIKPPIKQFQIEEYQNNGTFTKPLLELLNIITKEKEDNKKLKRIRKNRFKKSSNVNVARVKGFINLNTIDCRILAKTILGSPKKTFSNYVLYKCPNHDDTHPSLSVYEKSFVCGRCGNLNAYNFVKMYYGLSDSKDIINKFKELY